MVPDRLLAEWCRAVLGAAPGRILFRAGHLSQVVAVELTGGQRMVIKARRFQHRIAGCIAVQAALAEAGFPCTVPLAGPTEVGEFAVTAEPLLVGGGHLSLDGGARPFAALLARLIETAPTAASVPALGPSPPWAGWDHPGARLWPDRDDRGRDLNQVAGPG